MKRERVKVRSEHAVTGGGARRVGSFIRGFKNGLAGPVLLIEPAKITTRKKRGIKEDWMAVGNNLRWAMKHAD